MIILQSIIFIGALIYAGIYDYNRRIIPDRVHLIIIIYAVLTNFSLGKSLLGLFLLPIPFLVAAFWDENSVGGGDIKLVAAISFFLGFHSGILAVIISLSLFTILSFILNRTGKDLIPLGPYLAIGSIIAFLI